MAVAAAPAAATDYRTSKEDLRVFERGLATAQKAVATVFPDGIDRIDLVVQDSSHLYIYSRKADYPFKKLRKAGAYTVYKLPHGGRPQEHEMWGCRGGPVALMPKKARAVIAENYLRCAPWGSFRRAQEKKRSVYRFVDAYQATLIHELAHQYQDQHSAPLPEAVEIRRRLEAAGMAGDELESAALEGYAEWCELKASKKLYPKHYARKDAEGKKKTASKEAHDAGLRAAVEFLEGR